MAAVGSVARLSSSSVWTVADDEIQTEFLARKWRPVNHLRRRKNWRVCRQTHRPDPEMMTSFLTILYEDLLIGEQVDVYSHRSSMSCCGTNSLNVPALQQLPACSSGCFWPGAAATSQGRDEEGGKGGKEEDNRVISCPRINESCFLPCAYSKLYDAMV